MSIKDIKWPKNRPNVHKIHKQLPLQDPPKLYTNFDFWFENIPSGNPALQVGKPAGVNVMF
jgi:hypothetical protein